MDATDDTRWVSIRTVDQEVDVALPANIPICDVVPEVLDLIGGDEFVGQTLHLARIDGQVLDPTVTLAGSSVCDGELLILSAGARPLPVPRFEVSTVVADAVTAIPPPSWRIVGRTAVWAVVGWATVLLMVVLGRAILVPATGHAAVGAVAAVVAVTGAVAVHRVDGDRAGAVGLGVLATVLAGLTAAGAPLGRPGLPAFLLAMSAVSATSLGAWRLLNCAPEVFVPLGAAAMAASAATMGAVAGWWPAPFTGPMLATGSLAALALSARLSVRALSTAGLTDAQLEARARTAHHRLTVLVVAAAGAAALGTAVTAATTEQPLFAAGFIAIVGAALALRARSGDVPYRVVTLGIPAGIAWTSLIALSAREAEPNTAWVGGALLLIAAGAAWFGHDRSRLPVATHRVFSILDLAVAAAVVPSACAAAGAFDGLTAIGLP